MAKKPTAAPGAEEGEAPKKGKLLLIVSVTCLLLGLGGGGAAWYFLKSSDPDAQAEVKPKPPVFLPLESFTVNLLPHEGQPQYIQAGLTLKLEDTATSDLIKERIAEVRHRILLLLSAKRGNDLLPVSGKQKLAQDIAFAVKEIIEPAKPVRAARKASAEEAEEDGGEKAASSAAKEEEGEAAEAKPARKKAKRPVDSGPKVEVLFTSLIIQ